MFSCFESIILEYLIGVRFSANMLRSCFINLMLKEERLSSCQLFCEYNMKNFLFSETQSERERVLYLVAGEKGSTAHRLLFQLRPGYKR